MCPCCAGSHTTFVPVPAQTPFAGYWQRDERTTPPPQPIDLLLEGSWLLHKAKGGAKGIEVRAGAAQGSQKWPVISLWGNFILPSFPHSAASALTLSQYAHLPCSVCTSMDECLMCHAVMMLHTQQNSALPCAPAPAP